MSERGAMAMERRAAWSRTTAEDLETLAIQADDGRRRELIAGRLVVLPPRAPRRGRTAGRLTRALGAHVLAHRLGEIFGAETGFQLARDPDTVRGPDVAFVRRERVQAVGDTDD